MKKKILIACYLAAFLPLLFYAHETFKRCWVWSEANEDYWWFDIALCVYRFKHAEEYPTSEFGCHAALSKVVNPEFPQPGFAMRKNITALNDHLKKHKTLPEELCLYAYVQGLRVDDPGYLIHVYRKAKTNWRTSDFWKGYEAKPGWWACGVRWQSDDHTWLTAREFADRLEKTLQFLEKEKRPYWEQTIKEHRPFLEKLRREISDADTDT